MTESCFVLLAHTCTEIVQLSEGEQQSTLEKYLRFFQLSAHVQVVVVPANLLSRAEAGLAARVWFGGLSAAVATAWIFTAEVAICRAECAVSANIGVAPGEPHFLPRRVVERAINGDCGRRNTIGWVNVRVSP
eukprot:m.148380 g.148380  ORF g.148380 m.148380 type:complete len:133 (+) comp14208_c0_seq1:846-1244(+)